ncbi:MAG: SUMF1/EgtB/PvdO family nonheme iron enzyme [Opitutaceae bacterium]
MNPDDPDLDPFIGNASSEPEQERLLEPGQSFGNFRVVECISSGLIANYYRMQHVRDLSDVTVGVFHSRTLGDGKFLKRLSSLQKTLEGFDHEGIPKIKDCGLIEGHHCIYLEPVLGVSLSQYFAENAEPGLLGLDIEPSTKIVAQLFGILGYAHSKGLDHRDLDTDLIFIQDDGSLQVLGVGIKLTLGNILFEAVVSASVSPLIAEKTNERLNSFDIMSPEYRAGLDEDARVDIYAIGMIAYWLMTARKASLVEYLPAATYIEGLSEEWELFFAQCIVRDLEERYESCKIALIGLQETTPEEETEEISFVQRQIDRILIPKRVAARGGAAARAYRLCMIGIVGISLVGLAAYFVGTVFVESDGGKAPDVAKETSAAEIPNLNLSVSPEGAIVRFVGHGEKFVLKDGQVSLNVLSGDYSLSITAAGYLDERVKVSIPEDSEAPVTVSVQLKEALADIQVASLPNSAITVIDQKGSELNLGVTNSEGVLIAKERLPVGTYTIQVKKEGYELGVLDSQEIALGKMAEIQVDLVPLPSVLTILTQPEGAQILVNDEPVGLTPLVLDSMEADDGYRVIARLEGYRAQGRLVEIEPGQNLELDFGELVARSGGVVFDVAFTGVSTSDVPELLKSLTVEFDGKEMPYGEGVFEGIKEGEFQVNFLHPTYSSSPSTISISDGETILVDVSLSPRPGIVDIVLPAGIEVSLLINGQSVEIRDGRLVLPAGRAIKLDVVAPNYLTASREVMLEPTERVVWEVSLVPVPGPQKGDLWSIPYLGSQFAWIPPGSFTMGSPPMESGRLPNEGPQTKVSLTQGFWAGVHEVSQEKFVAIMKENPSKYTAPNKPVETVSWEDAKQFCELLSKVEKAAGRLPEGYVYRLPTEAEWEYLARAGTETPFSFGSEADVAFGNFRGVYPSGRKEGDRRATHYGPLPVGSFKPNSFGLYDVHGNVQEWTLDYYNGRLPGGALTDPAPRGDGSRISVRGGSWEDFAKAARSAIRDEVAPDTLSSGMGFRVVLAPEK